MRFRMSGPARVASVLQTEAYSAAIGAFALMQSTLLVFRRAVLIENR